VKGLSLVIFLSLLLIPAPSPGRDFYEEQLDRGLRNSEAYSYFLIKKSMAEPPNTKEILEEALRHSPDWPAIYFELSKASFSFSTKGMYEALAYMLTGLEAYRRNFWWSFTMAGSLFLSLFLSFVISMIIVILLRLPRDIPLLSHDMMEQKTMVFVLPILVSALISPLLLIGGILIILGLYLKKGDRVVIYLYLLFLLISPLIFKATTITFSVPSSDSLKAIVQVNESRDNRYALSVLRNPEDDIALFSYALALKREGNYDEAIAIYTRLIANDPDPIFYNNLANCYVAKNDMERAKQLYEKAVQIKPLVSSYYNLSQVYRVTLDLVKGEEYFLFAQELDRKAVSSFQAIFSHNPNRFVIDEVQPLSKLWEYSIEKATRVSTLGLSTLPPAYMPFIALLFGIFSYILNIRIKHRAYRCGKCGTIICSICERRLLWRKMCTKCYRSLAKLHELDARERIARIQSVYRYQRRQRRIIKTLYFMLPGSVQIYAGDILKGLLFLWPFLFFLSLFVINSKFVVETPRFSHLWLTWGSLLLMAMVFFVSIIITGRRLAKGWL